jgi:gamma-glutamyltranspeptidase
LSILNILEGYRLTMPQSAVDRHRLVEAFKFGYAQRTRLGDIHYLPDDVVDRIAEFTLKDTAAHIRHRINDDRTQPVDYYGAEYAPVDSPGTTHISTVDGQDMAVSITSTINLSFGSKLYNADTGIILNNEMDDFSSPNITNYFGLRPSKNNFITPGKRPLSSAVPTIIERDGVFEMAIGASGGSKITTAVVQAILNQLEYGMNVQQAVSAPRLHHQLLPHEVWMEQPMDESAEVDLTLRGHAVVRKQDLADVQAVVRLPSGVVHGGADPRKNGHAAAF